MPKSMKKEEYKDLILTALGGTIVDIELEEDIDKFIRLAFMKVKPRIGTAKFMTIPLTSQVSLKALGIYAVINVYRTSPISGSTSGSTSGTINDINSIYNDALLFNNGMLLTGYNGGYTNTYNQALGITNADSVAISLLTTQLINQASGRSSDIDFESDDEYLFIETAGAGVAEVTLEYIPDYKDVEEVEEPFWQNIIFDLALAYTKIALGRARGKYRISNLPYEMDADTLLSEGQQELERITEKLEENNDLDYFLD